MLIKMENQNIYDGSGIEPSKVGKHVQNLSLNYKYTIIKKNYIIIKLLLFIIYFYIINFIF